MVRLDPATGGVVAAHRFGGAGNEYIYAIVPLAGGDYIAAGSATEPTTIGGVAIPRAAGNEAAFWLRANAAGAAQWVRYASTNRERVLHAAMGPTGHVYLSGLNEGNMTFGGVPVTASGTAYVARIDPSSGAPVWIDTTDVDWSEYFGIRRFVVDDSDVLHVTWWARSQSTASTFGGVNIGWTPGGGGWQSYVATVVGSTGAVTRIERFQDPSTLIQSRAIAISGGRNVISGVYWPQSGTGMVDGVSFPTYLTSGPHLDAFTAYLTF